MTYQTSADGNLLQRTTVNLNDIKRTIDPIALGITPQYIKEQANLKHGGLGKDLKFVDNRVKPKWNGTEEDLDRYFITELCLPYNPPPDERDIFVFYDNIGCLAGSSGYLRIRDGYVYGHRGYAMS